MAHIALTKEQIMAVSQDITAINKSLSDLLEVMFKGDLATVNMDYKTAIRHIAWLRTWADKAVGNARGAVNTQRMADTLKTIHKKD